MGYMLIWGEIVNTSVTRCTLITEAALLSNMQRGLMPQPALGTVELHGQDSGEILRSVLVLEN